MLSTPSNTRTSTYPPGGPFPRTPRLIFKPLKPYESGLSLTRVIGTTVASPAAFDSLPSSPIFAYTAGAAAVVVSINDDSNISQRFFRARPAVGINYSPATGSTPVTPASGVGDGRGRGLGYFKDSGVPINPSTPDNFDSPKSLRTAGRTRDSIKAATCISLSRDGKLLATGYAPRVLIFSLQDGSSDIPLTAIGGHDYGVRAVAFSPDQKYLASLGDQQDGYLYVYSINPRTGTTKLHSSGRCTTLVQQMIWLGNALVTIGTRHIKVWRVEEPRSTSPKKPKFALDGTPQPQPTPVPGAVKTLPGRNVILGELSEGRFSCIAAISDCKAIVCSDKGDVCLLEDCEDRKLMKVTSTGFPVTCVAVDSEERLVRIGGLGGRTKVLSLDQMLTPNTPPESPDSLETDCLKTCETHHFSAMGYAARSLITINSRNLIEITPPSNDLAESQVQSTPFPAHGASVNGVRLLSQPNAMDAVFITWSADGTILFWDLDGDCKKTVKLELEDEENQCLVVRPTKGGQHLVTGDKNGFIRVIDTPTNACISNSRAHQSDIQDITLYESDDETLMASCGRDMTVQLFRFVDDQWSHVQTLNEHTATVTGVLFAEDGTRLISCSSNRDIQVRQIVRAGDEGVKIAAITQRVISLKAAPISMSVLSGEQSGNLIVSMTDRTIGTFELTSGRLVSSFGAAQDGDNKDTVSMAALFMGMPSAGKPTILAGVSSTDKSVRIYDGVSGAFLDRDYGHSAAVKDVALLETSDSDNKTLISTGSDGCIMIWNLSSRPPWSDTTNVIDGEPQFKDSPSAKAQPLRKVLSKAELMEFQRQSPTPPPPTGSRSPPRVIRRKVSRYGLSSQQSPSTLVPPVSIVNSKHFISSSDDAAVRRNHGRNRSRSPRSNRTKEMRRPSLASLQDSTKKSTGNFSEFGSLGNSTESLCRTLQSFRKKLKSGEPVKEESLRELDYELRVTMMALGERTTKTKSINEAALTNLLDQYSEKLVEMFDEKLRLNRLESNDEVLLPETPRPKTAGSSTVSTPV
ncbi:hypothetical protein HYALB_00007831 [Hymenoscyphus albidus]|uniref:WD40 repeat-like protein n=1 Tax=Hymenoscyphus albidus TaxID=595503 RepID=A0A9N9LB19_9HELO|nr:hypothetical protein HYALB_00007831 [Hymenoscyphus albidus]